MPLSSTEILLRLLAAVALGGAIGYERELHEQPAGLRTHLLVSLASAVFTMVSLELVFFQHFEGQGVTGSWPLLRLDAGRLASNVVVGIGFLGGGAILHAGLSIKGLTTAASLWLCAGVGMAAGGGMFVLGVFATALAFFGLVVLRLAVEEPRKKIVRLSVSIELQGDFVSRAELLEFLKPVGGEVSGADYSRDMTDNRSRMLVDVKLPDASLEELLMKRLEELPGLRRVEVTRPG